MNDDPELLRRYAQDRSEEAFAELVQRHLGIVYGAAWRILGGDAHRARDVAQIVFTDLARKAPALLHHTSLTGWLYTSTRFAAAKAIRAEQRRQVREREAQIMHDLMQSPDPAINWDRLRPVLDDVLGEMNGRDREAVLLRFFEGRGFTEVGAVLCLREDAARRRVDRALDRMRIQLARRGVTSTSAALALVLSGQAAVAAPAGLAGTVTGTALGAVGSAGAGGLGFFQLMSATKSIIGTAGFFWIAVLLGLSVTGLTTNEYRRALLQARGSASASGTLTGELSTLRRELSVTDRRNAALRGQIAQLTTGRGREPGLPNALAAAPDPAAAERERLFLEIQGLVAESSAADEFRKLGLSDAQLKKYAALMRDAGKAQMIGYAVDGASAAGLSVADYRARQQAEFQRSIRSLVGEQAYAQLQADSASPPAVVAARPLVSPLASYLAASSIPLSSRQAEQLLQVLENNSTAIKSASGQVPAAVMAQTQGILSPLQLAAWQRMQDIRQDYQEKLNAQLQEMIHPSAK